jgi:invasion protein IalB
VFGQWSLRCEQPKRGQERCSIVQDVVTPASGQRVVRAEIGLVPGGIFIRSMGRCSGSSANGRERPG